VTPTERGAALAAIADEVRVCRRCRLAEQRTQAVPGEGSAETEVVFVGEGPGHNEDQQGRPFVGAAGSLLDELITTVGWRRPDVFITNVVKCRPPGNRDPEPDEMAACAPYLRRQLEVLDPALVVTLGRFSLGTFMPGARISQVHGTVRPVDPSTGARAARAFAMYHPAAALRQGALKETMRDDMSRIPAALIAAREGRTEPATPGRLRADEATHPQDAPDAVPTDGAAMAASVLGPPAIVPDLQPIAPDPRPIASEPPASADDSAPPDPVSSSDAEAIDALGGLEGLDGLAPLEVTGIVQEQPSETDQMRLFR
jgi:DNA polymerase